MLELKNVSGGYGKRTVISDLSAIFPKGELTSVIGPNGCGKSTLLMLCAGLISCTSGAVLVGGKDILAIPRNDAAKQISYLEQMKNPGSISVRTLVSHGRFPYLGYPRRYTDLDRAKVEEAMSMAGVADISDRMMNELSGGQQQRVRIAMVLAQDTDVILLDEPLTYLDVRYKLEVMELIAKLRSLGKTVVAVMHDLELAFAYSDKIAVMENGRLTAFDSPENIALGDTLKSAFGVNAEYCEYAGRYFFKRAE